MRIQGISNPSTSDSFKSNSVAVRKKTYSKRIFTKTYLLLVPLVLIAGAAGISKSFDEPKNDTAPENGLREKNSVVDKTRLDKIPHIVKQPDFGGEACLAMCLNALGHKSSQGDVFNATGIDPVLARGCTTSELCKAAKQIGFEPGKCWFYDSTESNAVDQAFGTALSELESQRPTIFLTRQSNGSRIIEQFVLFVGYDADNKTVSIHDPSTKAGKFREIQLDQFRRSMVLSDAQNREYAFCLKTNAKQIKIESNENQSFSDADYAQHIMKLKKRLPSDGFQIVIQKPFVVVGDESETMVKQRAVSTVKWSVDRLKGQYFAKDPKYILDVWLFKDKDSYYSNAKKLWGSKPTTIYGYYSSHNRCLVMNIGTGGGTLVHEIVHPFIESNFEDCPSWFNEGLASLYEQSRGEGNKIYGSTNWRLRGLQIAIDSDRLPSFEKLMSTTRREFYDDDRGNNYAQARYLCYYLQQKGLLNQYYHEFVKNVKQDSTGIKTLKKVLKTDDLDAFKTEWQKYVMKLRF